jgi:hypothetical protein
MAQYPASTLYLGACGFGLMMLGPHLLLLIGTFLSSADFFLKVLYGQGGSGLSQQAAEYPLFVLIPFCLLFLVAVLWQSCLREKKELLICRWSVFQDAFEAHTVLIFRWTVLITLSLVFLHKLNGDFFEPALSCEKVIKGYFGKSWSFSWLPLVTAISSPLLVVLVEGPVCIALLLWCRRVGIVFVTAVFGMIAMCDALVVTLCVIFPALSFLEDEDRKIIQKNARNLVGIWLLLLSLWLPYSCANYLSVRPWFQPALYQSVLLGIIVCVGGAQVISWLELERDGIKRSVWERLGFKMTSLIPAAGPGRWVVRAVVAFWLLNGLSPYLGHKFNYSFAMLSNLRVDDARWNHLIIPKWVRLTEHDGFFHVQKADLKFALKNDEKSRGQVRLRPGLFSPQAFHDELKRLSKLSGGVEVALLVEHGGRAYDYQGSLKDLTFQLFLDRLPQPHGHWLHDYLPADGPMGCKH